MHLFAQAMHEASIMESVLETAAAEAAKAGAGRILRIRLKVGILSGVVPEALEFAFKGLKSGTMAAEATLEIEPEPAVFRCLECGALPKLSEMAFECPACGGALVVDHGGGQLELAQLELT
jgi:hydrogenase nickel incorporation protein HypA/HybF